MFSWMERYASSLRLKEMSGLVRGETFGDSALHMSLCLTCKLSTAPVKIEM